MKKIRLLVLGLLSCTLLSFIACNNNPGENPSTPEALPTSLADFVGSTFVYIDGSDWLNVYMYVKDANTIVTCSRRGESDEWYISEDEVGEDGSLWCDTLTLDLKLKVVSGKLVSYECDDIWNVEKADDTSGLLGFWEFADAGAERPYPKVYRITEDTYSCYSGYYEDFDEEATPTFTTNYTLENGCLIVWDEEVHAYYDGEHLYTRNVKELQDITTSALADEIEDIVLRAQG